jgi:hypothetical protein
MVFEGTVPIERDEHWHVFVFVLWVVVEERIQVLFEDTLVGEYALLGEGELVIHLRLREYDITLIDGNEVGGELLFLHLPYTLVDASDVLVDEHVDLGGITYVTELK